MSARPAEWAAMRERGNAFWSRLGLFLVQRLGWRFGRVLLLPITAWFLLSSPGARAASREYLGLALGRPARLTDIARHIHAFACSILDAPFFLARRTENFTVQVTGLEHLEKLAAEGRGCVLLGGHLGSFEVLRHVGQGSPVPVRPLMYRRNAGVMTTLLERLDPALARAVIPLGEPDSMLQAREAIERGEIIGILADRAAAGDRSVVVPFLGRDAAFPAGPFIVAAMLGAPVLGFRGVCTGPRRYEVRFEPFAERITLRREHRAEDLREVALHYARWLEQGCRAHPCQWFNFFPFWKASLHAADTEPARAPPSATGPDAPGAGPGSELGGALHARPVVQQPR
ncbi:acyltransferase [Sediminicoccus sp. KRV36]|uniref:LpxL/LpxP family acyltransferase n=1 Tax=Sediminicoccus sp. KRV36 TaxID=3133721 RepID=UPI00200C75D7|nr:acyltransferase [Sediminicoccus rosea]UPY37591.1 acyltransferase [Sediminicoccus rosea]